MYPRLDGIVRSSCIRTSLLTFGDEVVESIRDEWQARAIFLLKKVLNIFILGMLLSIIFFLRGNVDHENRSTCAVRSLQSSS